MKNGHVQYSEHPGEVLAYGRFQIVEDPNRPRIPGDHVVTPRTGNENGPLVMRPLGDDNTVWCTIDLGRAHDGIERSHPGFVHEDAVRRNSPRDEIFTHHSGLVVIWLSAVAAYDETVHLAGLEELRRSIDAVFIMPVQPAGGDVLRRPEDKAGVALGNIGQPSVATTGSGNNHRDFTPQPDDDHHPKHP